MSSSGITLRLTVLALVATASAAPAKQVHIACPCSPPITRAEVQPVDGGYAIVSGVPVRADGKPSRNVLPLGASVRIDRTLLGSSERVVRSNRP